MFTFSMLAVVVASTVISEMHVSRCFGIDLSLATELLMKAQLQVPLSKLFIQICCN